MGEIFTGVYVGCGFFRRPSGWWVFVNRQNRPPWLVEGVEYELSYDGALYYVIAEVTE